MYNLPRFLSKPFDGFIINEVKEFFNDQKVHLYLIKEEGKKACCHKCKTELSDNRGGKYRQSLKHLPLFNMETKIFFWRQKGYCPNCKKHRAEHVDFISEYTPHHTKEYSWWVGTLCEIASVNKASWFTKNDKSTVWRMDFARMKQMLSHYKIPHPNKISVDEVYARKKDRETDQSKSDKYFTVIMDMDTGRVIWVGESRRKEALEEFFILLGDEACKKIKIVASDDNVAYGGVVEKYCPQATHVLDRFHVIKLFTEALNEERKKLHEKLSYDNPAFKLTAGKQKWIFIKKAKHRTHKETIHISKALGLNHDVAYLEMIKERMYAFYEADTRREALNILREVKQWIEEGRFKELKKWYKNFYKSLRKVLTFFGHRFTSALSEGMNNVIKMLKRRAFGYRNMYYFRLKIMQVCGYLSAIYMNKEYQALQPI
jgi:transposase